MFALLGRALTAANPSQSCRMISTTVMNPAARKGTRAKALSKKVKVEVKKVGFIPHNQREQNKLNIKRQNKHVDDSYKSVSTDNVVIGKYYRKPVYTVAEAIKCHRETHHPTMFGNPNAQLFARIELFMQGEKKTRFVDNFSRTALIPHKYDHGQERTLLVFAKGQEWVTAAMDAGATHAGGPELIKEIQNGKLQLSDFEYVLAHPNILSELVVLRGLMRKNFPNIKLGSLDADVTSMVQRFKNGIQYKATKDEYQPDFGLIEACIGTLDMDTQHLEDNLVHLLKDIDEVRPKREGKFITRVILKSPPSGEQLKIDPFLYVQENRVKKGRPTQASEELDEDNDDAEEADKKEASN